jgi:hypothetical protein
MTPKLAFDYSLIKGKEIMILAMMNYPTPFGKTLDL